MTALDLSPIFEAASVLDCLIIEVRQLKEELTDNRSKLLTEEQAAEYINMSPSYLKRGRMNGHVGKRIPPPAHIEVGPGTIRYRRAELDRWVEALLEVTREGRSA